QQVAAAGAGAPLRDRKRDGREQARQHAPDQRVLADDDLADFLFEAGDDLSRRLRVQRPVFQSFSHRKSHNPAMAAAATISAMDTNPGTRSSCDSRPVFAPLPRSPAAPW